MSDTRLSVFKTVKGKHLRQKKTTYFAKKPDNDLQSNTTLECKLEVSNIKMRVHLFFFLGRENTILLLSLQTRQNWRL